MEWTLGSCSVHHSSRCVLWLTFSLPNFRKSRRDSACTSWNYGQTLRNLGKWVLLFFAVVFFRKKSEKNGANRRNLTALDGDPSSRSSETWKVQGFAPDTLLSPSHTLFICNVFTVFQSVILCIRVKAPPLKPILISLVWSIEKQYYSLEAPPPTRLHPTPSLPRVGNEPCQYPFLPW